MGFAYKFHDPDGVYFVTCATVQWVDVFTRSIYSDIVVESLQYCIDKKGLVLHAWVIMPNHIHLVLSRNGKHSLSDIMRDFKKFRPRILMIFPSELKRTPKSPKGDLNTVRKRWVKM